MAFRIPPDDEAYTVYLAAHHRSMETVGAISIGSASGFNGQPLAIPLDRLLAGTSAEATRNGLDLETVLCASAALDSEMSTESATENIKTNTRPESLLKFLGARDVLSGGGNGSAQNTGSPPAIRTTQRPATGATDKPVFGPARPPHLQR